MRLRLLVPPVLAALVLSGCGTTTRVAQQPTPLTRTKAAKTTMPADGGGASAPILLTGPSARLSAVDASGPGDVWAVGMRTARNSARPHSLVDHWNGHRWSIVTTPDIGWLNGVAVPAPGDVWTVLGHTVLHRKPSGTWSVIKVPNLPPQSNLVRVSASGPNDVWFAGFQLGDEYAHNTFGWHGLVVHWNGRRWHVATTPNPTRRGTYLEGIEALSPSDVWAAGYVLAIHNTARTLVMHWDGRTWKTVPSPSPGDDYSVLWGMGRDADGGVWLTGDYGGSGHPHMTMLLADVTGGRVNLTPDPSDNPLGSITGASGVSSTDVWAVGGEPSSSLSILHWNGSAWQRKAASGSWTTNTLLNDVADVSATDAWAVGDHGSKALIAHWDGSEWTGVAEPLH